MTSVQNQQLSSVIVKLKLVGCHPTMYAQGPHSHILMTGGGGGVRRIFWVLTFWPKGIFFGSMKDAGIFLGLENNTGIFLAIVFFISSNQQ